MKYIYAYGGLVAWFIGSVSPIFIDRTVEARICLYCSAIFSILFAIYLKLEENKDVLD